MNNNESNQEFKTGDLVELKSGGPVMTVNDISEKTGEVYCVWFAGEYNKVHSTYFLPDTLKLVDKSHKKGRVSYKGKPV